MLGVVGPVPAVDRHVPSLDRGGHLRPVGPLGGVALVGGYGAVGRGRGDGVHGLVRDVHHGLGAGQGAVPRQGALLAVELALLPLVQLPHGVVPHGPPLVLGPSLVVRGRGGAAEALGPGLAVPRERSVPFGVAGHDLGAVAGHVPW